MNKLRIGRQKVEASSISVPCFALDQSLQKALGLGDSPTIAFWAGINPAPPNIILVLGVGAGFVPARPSVEQANRSFSDGLLLGMMLVQAGESLPHSVTRAVTAASKSQSRFMVI